MESVYFPRLVFWETTAGCNLACIHCRRIDVARTLMKSDLSTGEARSFIDGLADFSRRYRKKGSPTILVMSGGEPLFRPDISELIDYATRSGLFVALATNGTLVDDATADRIVAAGTRRVAISIDGADETTHDEFRKQPGSLQRALSGLRKLRDRGMSMQINCTITRHNVDQRDKLFDLALELNVDALHLFMLVPVGCGVQIADSNMLSGNEYEKILRWFYRKSRKTRLSVKATCAPHYYRIMRQEAQRNGETISVKTHGMDAVTKGCLAGTGVCFISHDGKVFPCGYLPVESGNIRTGSFESVWMDSPVFSRLRNDSMLGGKCGTCDFSKVCMGCRARAYYESGDIMDEEPYCVYEPKQSPNART